jgi:hypothetical protein
LIIGQSVGLDARFGGQIAPLKVGGVESRTRGGWGKLLQRAGSSERKRRIDLFERPHKATFYRCQSSPLTKDKKTSKMKGGPNKLMKTNGQFSDKMSEANK